jgi:hypothetical protein
MAEIIAVEPTTRDTTLVVQLSSSLGRARVLGRQRMMMMVVVRRRMLWWMWALSFSVSTSRSRR